MDTGLSNNIEAFRQDVRRFLTENLPEDIRALVAAEHMDLPREAQQCWRRILNEKGWACPSWPVAYGGTDWSDEQFYVFERELALADAPRLDPYGVVMLGPTLIEFGTEEQKRRFLPGILSGEVLWCQGFSEPNAGSDLAALKCRAERHGEHYHLNGSKIWTSDAHIADWMFGLFRSDASGKKQHGITFLLLDMQSPGIKVEPLMTFEGTHEVNQVFFDDVRVPVENRLGEGHQGWGIAKYLLGLERFGTAEVSRCLASLRRLKELASNSRFGEAPLLQNRRFADRLAQAEIALRAVEVTEQRFLFGPGGADALGPEASLLKIRGTEVQQLILALAHEAQGYFAHLVEVPGENNPGSPISQAVEAGRAHYNYRKTSIYSGSNEIQKNIIAKAVLGL